MNCIYLIRHGHPEKMESQAYCLGRASDPPLSGAGRRQAKALTACFEGMNFGKIYCSVLKRSYETAELISDGRWSICRLPGLDEISVGEWEGLSFNEIREKYPELYAFRGKDWAIFPPGGEDLADTAGRMENTLQEIKKEELHDILAVTHDGAIRALLWRLLKMDTKKDAMIRQSYGSITVLTQENGKLTATAIGKMPEDFPQADEIEELWDFYKTPRNVRAHCYAVCAEALKIYERLQDAGILLVKEQLRAAALLHDMCRTDGKRHPLTAAKLIRKRGYLKIAHAIELHHDGDFKEDIDEAQVLFLADKRVIETRVVTIEERFDASRKKCFTAEAKKNHDIRYAKALSIQKKLDERLEEHI